METAPLKGFATWARTELITQVSARIAAVLAPASPERTENPRAIRALETDIAKAGGNAKGKDGVADKVAYTWFNRIIALRFMDANGYTNAGVVSPAPGQTVGQPEVLADAKRGTFDPDVVNAKTAKDVTGLLDGTRSSSDPQGEAYTLLLAEYSRYWNKSMPFMFEREGDYTELLIPSNLLADESILARAVTTMTSAVCEDVEVIGWLYQFYISERKDEVFAGFKKNKKAGAAEIPAATQLFTPHWIVRYLVENSVGRLWMLNHPESRLVDQMDYYIAPVDEETDFLKLAGPEELTVIDPACGSGHMLTYAFDLLYSIYEEEGYSPSEIPSLIMTHNVFGTEIDPRAGALAAFALTMKARERQRTFFNKSAEPNICVIEEISFTTHELPLISGEEREVRADKSFLNGYSKAATLGALIQPDSDRTAQLMHHLKILDNDQDLLSADMFVRANKFVRQSTYLSSTYAVAVTNPPYMGARNIQTSLKSTLENQFPKGKSDLYSAFMIRSLNFVPPGGVVAMITMQSWMFLKSYDELRRHLLESGRLSSMLHLGARAFDAIGGEVVSTTAFTLTKDIQDARGTFIRLVDLNSEIGKRAEAQKAIHSGLASERLSQISGKEFQGFPGTIIAYWLPKPLRDLFASCESVRELADPRKGLDTGFNDRFLRYWWEVDIDRSYFNAHDASSARRAGAKWFPYNKGGESRKWYGNHWFVVDWENDGAEIRSFGTESGGKPRSAVRNSAYYFKSAVSWSDVGGLGFRFYPNGFIHDNKGPSVFSDDSTILSSLLAYLNSPLAGELLAAIAPTMSTQVGDVAILPAKRSEIFTSSVATLVEQARSDWDSFETSWNFLESPLVLAAEGRCLSDATNFVFDDWYKCAVRQQAEEVGVNRNVATLYGVSGDIGAEVTLDRVSLSRNPVFTYGAGLSYKEYLEESASAAIKELVSYAVGCMFGRYSLDRPGLVLANQGATFRDYLTDAQSMSFAPDADNVLPIVDGDWFEDDIVARLREFLRVAFGDEHFEANLRFVEQSLDVKNLRDYFITRGGKSKFYEDHVKRYKKRPIYWMFSSPKGSFNALIYMHRYNTSTVSTVLNDYLREYEAKLDASLQNLEREASGDSAPRQQAAAAKEAERLRKILVELSEYEHEVMYPLASEQIEIDLNDGVKANYAKFGSALKKIQGL